MIFRFFFLLALAPLIAGPLRSDSPGRTIVYFYWAEGCPHCAEARLVLESLATPDRFELRSLELTRHRENARSYLAMAARFGFKAKSVPAVFIGDRYWIGYNAEVRSEITRQFESCRSRLCPDAAERPAAAAAPGASSGAAKTAIEIPFFGVMDLTQGSLWANTALIAFADGFNPCSLWVLTMLLALILHTGSRTKILIIGSIFLSVTSLFYVAFIAGIFSVMQMIGFVKGVRIAMAILALVMGLINIKDFFWFRQGVSLTITDKSKSGILERMRGVLASANSFWPLVAATVLLAAGVSLAEFSCTAGFPVLWVNLVQANQVETRDFVLLLLFYMFIYQLDEMVIFLAVVITLRIGRFEEKQGRALKLLGGTLMCALSVVLLLKPHLMDDLKTSLAVFAAAILVATLIWILHRAFRRETTALRP